MKFAASLIIPLIPTILGFVAGQVPVLTEYDVLFDLCESGGPSSYVGVVYANSTYTTYTTYDFNECYPYSLGNKVLAQMAVFCKTVTCFNNPNPDCTGGAVPPVPVLAPEGLTLINAADFVQLIGQGATCQENGLS